MRTLREVDSHLRTARNLVESGSGEIVWVPDDIAWTNLVYGRVRDTLRSSRTCNTPEQTCLMKTRGFIILSVAAILAGVAIHFIRASSRPHAPAPSPVESHAPATPAPTKNGEPGQDIAAKPVAGPVPRSIETVAIQPAAAVPPAAVQRPAAPVPNPHDPAQFWERQAERFHMLTEQLALEENPAKRNNLIQNIAQYVRIDTLGTLDWTMGLEDPNEQRAALEAVNKYALSGIGARIGVDETGFPRIRETTILSAVAATGQVEAGDYIVGMVSPDGEPVSFQNLSVQQVVKHLRGQPGSEVQLLMERVSSDGNGESQAFDVSVQRSLLVIQPPY
jgi:hypothetical protein